MYLGSCGGEGEKCRLKVRKRRKSLQEPCPRALTRVLCESRASLSTCLVCACPWSVSGRSFRAPLRSGRGLVASQPEAAELASVARLVTSSPVPALGKAGGAPPAPWFRCLQEKPPQETRRGFLAPRKKGTRRVGDRLSSGADPVLTALITSRLSTHCCGEGGGSAGTPARGGLCCPWHVLTPGNSSSCLCNTGRLLNAGDRPRSESPELLGLRVPQRCR